METRYMHDIHHPAGIEANAAHEHTGKATGMLRLVMQVLTEALHLPNNGGILAGVLGVHRQRAAIYDLHAT
jgi:hypothetical protein